MILLAFFFFFSERHHCEHFLRRLDVSSFFLDDFLIPTEFLFLFSLSYSLKTAQQRFATASLLLPTTTSLSMAPTANDAYRRKMAYGR